MSKNVEIAILITQFIVNVVGLSLVFFKVVKALVAMAEKFNNFGERLNKCETKTDKNSDNIRDNRNLISTLEKKITKLEIWREKLIPQLIKLELELEDDEKEGKP